MMMKSRQSIERTDRNLVLPNPGCVLKIGEGRGFVFEYPYAIPQSVLRQLANLRLGQAGKMLKPRNRRLPHLRWQRVVVTAAHCLGKLPPANAMAYFEERTYNLLGSLDGSKSNVCAECLFVDPVGDIAVLGTPDAQEMYEQAEAYDALVDDATALRIGRPRTGRGWVLSLDGHWVPTTIKVHSTLFGTGLEIGPTKPGMSGSPILNDAGRAIGAVAIGAETIDQGRHRDNELSGPQPILIHNLPGRFISKVRG